MKVMEEAGHQWGGTKAETPSGAICVRTSNGFRYPLVFHSYDVATIETRFVDFKKDSYVDELVGFLEHIDGINAVAIRANGYGAKPKIAVSRFDDPKIAESLLALCQRVSTA